MGSPSQTQTGSAEGFARVEIEGKRCLERAGMYVLEGRFESALALLAKAEHVFPVLKGLPELTAVTQVCHAATWRPCSCSKRQTCRLPDWYRVLKVDEKADGDAIKKRYRQLALLLHPDKNKHVNSEAAFKLVSEAYACLSDKHKRSMFNLERSKNFCNECALSTPAQVSGVHSRHQPRVKTPQGSHYRSDSATVWRRESERLNILREKARARVMSMEGDWGSRRSKWIQQLASVRERFRGGLTDSSTTYKSKSSFVDNGTFSSPCYQVCQVEAEGILNAKTINNHVPTDLNLKTVLAAQGQRLYPMSCELRIERSTVGQSLDKLLSRLKAEGGPVERNIPAIRERVSAFAPTREGHNFMMPVEGESFENRFLADHCASKNARPSSAPHDSKVGWLQKEFGSPLLEINLSSMNIECSLPEVNPSVIRCQSVTKTDPSCTEFKSAVPSQLSSLEAARGPFSAGRQSCALELVKFNSERAESADSCRKFHPCADVFDDLINMVSSPALSWRQGSSNDLTSQTMPMTGPASNTGIGEQRKHSTDPGHQVLRRGSTIAVDKGLQEPIEGASALLWLKVQSFKQDSGSGKATLGEAGRSQQPVTWNCKKASCHSTDIHGRLATVKPCTWDMEEELEHEQRLILEQKQKSEALMGILERLREEAKSVAATLNRLKGSIGPDNATVSNGSFMHPNTASLVG